MKALILASSSRYRRELLARLGIPFECMSPDIDESPEPSELPGAGFFASSAGQSYLPSNTSALPSAARFGSIVGGASATCVAGVEGVAGGAAAGGDAAGA